MGSNEPSKDLKRMGVTYAIRNKLHFEDERLWKRFSARRLELIDTLDLSSKKASEQDAEIRKVAEALRTEFGYNNEYEADFDKLVRAAVQSVRRNRKRSSKSKGSNEEPETKRQRLENLDQLSPKSSLSESQTSKTNEDETESDGTLHRFLSEIAKINSYGIDEVYDLNYSRAKHFSLDDRAKTAIDSMIRPRLSNNTSTSKMEKNSTKLSISPSPSEVSNSKHLPTLPPISSLENNHSKIPDASSAKSSLINHIERSKSCSESVTKKSENIQVLGKAIVSSSIAYIFEKSFENINEVSMEYLRNKLNNQLFLARFFRELDPFSTNQVSDEIAVISLNTLLGACVKDFGFEVIMIPLCEVLYVSVLRDYPLIAKNSTPFLSEDYLRRHNNRNEILGTVQTPIEQPVENHLDNNSLNSLAAVATAQMREQPQPSPPVLPHVTGSSQHRSLPPPLASPFAASGLPPALSRSLSPEVNIREPRPGLASTAVATIAPVSSSLPEAATTHSPRHGKKQVLIKFLSSVLEFSYPNKNSAPPRFVELMENARSAFKLTGINDSILGVRNLLHGTIVRSDFDLERIFKTQEKIELEIFSQNSKPIPIYEITSTVIPNLHAASDTPKIILPPPLHRPLLSHSRIPENKSTFHFLSNSDDNTALPTIPPPQAPQAPALLPKFQPLL